MTIIISSVDDHELVISGIKFTLQGEPDFEVHGHRFQNMPALLTHLADHSIQVLLLDANMPGFDLLSGLDEIALRFPKIRIVVTSAHQTPEVVQESARRGAVGYLLKEESLSETLPIVIRAVAGGRTWYSPEVTHHLIVSQASTSRFTQIQMDVIRLMAKGETVEEIAARLKKRPQNIYAIQSAIREKIDAKTNEQVIVYAYRNFPQLAPVAP